MDDNALIVPEPGKEKETLRTLLALADKPRHVKLAHDEGGYFVPEYLAEKYTDATADTEVPEDPKPQASPKRRGRPPGSGRTKAATAADDKDGEE